jgi:Peptidase MA superfamily
MPRGRAIAATVVVGLMAVAAAPTAVLAVAPAFGPPQASFTFEVGIDLSETVTLPSNVRRVDAVVRTPESDASFVDPIATPASGSSTLDYQYDTPSGALLPNTPVTLGFRVTLDDGTTFDGPTTTVRYEDTRYAWKTLTGKLVRLHWTQGSDAFAQQALQIGEQGVAKAEQLLGATETQPIDFYVYADQQAFYDVLGPATRENVGGLADPAIRTLFANIAPTGVNDPWVATVVPHELTHVVFATATDNPYHAPPHWLNEGLAVYVAQGYDGGSRSQVEGAAGPGQLMPLHALTGQFPTTFDRFSLAYAESVSAVDFLIRSHGRDAVAALLAAYHRGLGDDQAFQAATGLDMAGFEAAWFADLGVPQPSPIGPQAAPAGPLPPGWQAGGNGAPLPSGAAATSQPGAPGASSGSDLLPAILVLVIGLAILLVGLAVAARRSRARRAAAGAQPEPPIQDPPEEPSESPPEGLR